MTANLIWFEWLNSKLTKMQNNLKDINGSYKIDELLTKKFMADNTQFSSIDELFEKWWFKIETEEDFKNIDQNTLDLFISKTTKFKSREDILWSAWEEFVSKKLFKGV